MFVVSFVYLVFQFELESSPSGRNIHAAIPSSFTIPFSAHPRTVSHCEVYRLFTLARFRDYRAFRKQIVIVYRTKVSLSVYSCLGGFSWTNI